MTRDSQLDAADRLIAAVTTAAGDALGCEPPTGTAIVASEAREGSKLAVAYPLAERTIVWCAPGLASRLAPLEGPTVLDNDEFTARASELGGVYEGAGHHRVLARPAPEPAVETSRLVVLDRGDAEHRALIAAFIDRCSDDDLDEAELSIELLDEAIVGVLDDAGALVSYASSRPWVFDACFDDVAVITRPDQRGRGLGAAAVAELSRRRQAVGHSMFYSCDIENIGSSRLAESVGFQLVYTVTAVSFG
jgi:GNAT superfamily N-acetyltransferase